MGVLQKAVTTFELQKWKKTNGYPGSTASNSPVVLTGYLIQRILLHNIDWTE
jgi:hypothetical protein